MKKIKSLFTLSNVVAIVALLVILGGTFSVAHANNGSQPCEPGKLCNPIKAPTIYCFFKDVLDVVTKIGFTVVVFFIIYSGFLFVTARGNDEALKTAKQAFTWTIIGAAVVLGAWVFSQTISNTIGKITGETVPSSQSCP